MAIMAMDTAQKNSVRAVCLALFCSKFAFAGEWQFTPSIDVDETYTDNVRLTPVNEESSLVSQAKLLIESSYEAQHTSFNFGSESTYAFYSHDHELDSDYHNLNSDFRFQLWPNGITL
ncbi:MAG: TIGR03016 family PEP-CTERM system-associated outer membrane protein, partial [Colwellia sp.]